MKISITKSQLSELTKEKMGMSRDEIVEILNEIYELQLEGSKSMAQDQLEELFEKVGIGYWSYPSQTD